MKSSVTLLSLVAASLLGSPALRAESGDPPPETGRPPVARADSPNLGAAWEMTAASRKAIDAGLSWLAGRQAKDGSFGSTAGYNRNCAIAALAGLAFLSEGSVPGRGRYGENVERVLGFILASTADSGLISADVSHGPMYGHGFAALFLAEVYGQTSREDVREKLRLAIRLIVDTQNREGGWRYMPIPQDADLSVTICQVMALRAARNAGVKVPKKTIDKAIEYVRRSQNADGGFNYTLQGGGSQFPRSAAGVAALQYAGIYSGKEIDNGMRYLLKFLPRGGGMNPMMGGHYYYGQYYAVQAFFLAGGDFWRQWFPAIRDSLIAQQQSDGSWTGDAGTEYGTAMALIILQVPNRYLPILER